MALSAGRRPPRALLVGAGLHLLVSVPLLAALIAFNRPQWHPIADLAQTELRVRDVGTRHSPLVGLAGRIGPFEDPGSHPGPLSFWALAPLYRLLGGTALALSASTALLHAVALGLALWIAHRRAGLRLMVAVGAAGVVLVQAYGAVLLLEPWNPYLPVSWWLVLLLAAWSVLDDDPPMLVVAVAAGSFCAQTHLPYLGLVGGVGGVLALASAWWIVRGGTDDEPGARARRVRWLLIALVVGVVVWIPPVIDQIDGVGNISRVRDSLTDPDGEPVGLVRGAKEVVERLGLGQWVRTVDPRAPSTRRDWNLSGLVVLALWAAAAVRSLVSRAAPAALRRLHAVVALALVLGVVAASRVHGELWYYLYLWAMGLAALTLVAIGWTAAVEVGARLGTERARSRLRRATLGLPLVVAVVAAVSFAAAAPSTEPSRPDLSDDTGAAAAETVAALRSGTAPGGGEDGRYLVRWDDPITIGSAGIGLVDELERQGFAVGVEAAHAVGATRHRVMRPSEATAVIVVAVGPAIERWEERAREGGSRIAEVDSRTDAVRGEVADLEARIDAGLRAAGRPDLVGQWRTNVFLSAFDPTLPEALRADLVHYVDFNPPLAVFAFDPADAG